MNTFNNYSKILENLLDFTDCPALALLLIFYLKIKVVQYSVRDIKTDISFTECA